MALIRICDRCGAVNSNTQLYKQAGNSIVVDVLAAILLQVRIAQCRMIITECEDPNEI